MMHRETGMTKHWNIAPSTNCAEKSLAEESTKDM